MQHSAAQSYQQVLQVCTVKDCSVHLASAIKHRVDFLTIGFHILVDPKQLIVLRMQHDPKSELQFGRKLKPTWRFPIGVLQELTVD